MVVKVVGITVVGTPGPAVLHECDKAEMTASQAAVEGKRSTATEEVQEGAMALAQT